MDNKPSLGQQGSAPFCNGHDSLSEEDSFVILSNPSGQFMSSDVNVSLVPKSNSINSGNAPPSVMVPMNQSSMNGPPSTATTGSFTTDVSPDEIQTKLNEVLQENVSLKETLYQNNLAMKQQLATLGTWQAEVAKLHQSHKEKFSDTKGLILKLRTENDELKRALKEANSRGSRNVPNTADSTLMAVNASLVKQVEELQNQVSAMTFSAKSEQYTSKSGPTKKEQELISLTEQLNRQLEIAERSRRQLGVDAERLQAQKTRLEREMTAIRNDLETHKERNKYAETEIEKLQHMCISRDNEIECLKAKLKGQEAMITDLKVHREKNLQQKADSDCKTTLDNKQTDLDEAVSSLESQVAPQPSDVSSRVNLTADTLNCEASGDSAVVEGLQNKIKELQKMLEDEQSLGKERVKMIMDAQEQFKCLFEQYQDAIKRLEESKKSQVDDTHRNSYYEVQVRGFTEKIDCMTAQIMKLEDDILRKNHEISELITKNKELEIENESIPILQLQMEVYQSDFNAEREARENMAGEKEHLAEDLRLLQQRNQRLLSELKFYQQNHGGQQQNTSSDNMGWNTISNPQHNHPRENTPPGPFDNLQ